jgi:serine/threonine protein kinase
LQVHRDLKLENVLLDRRGAARITDFGLAKTKESSIASVYVGAAGTMLYTAPELLTPGGTGKKSVDVHSYAIAVNEMFTRTPPYARDPPWDLDALRPAIVAGLRPELARALSPDMRRLLTALWGKPAERPTFAAIVATLMSEKEDGSRSTPPEVAPTAPVTRARVGPLQHALSLYLLACS